MVEILRPREANQTGLPHFWPGLPEVGVVAGRDLRDLCRFEPCLRLRRRIRRFRVHRRQFLPWSHVRNVRQLRDVSTGRVVNTDTLMIEQRPSRAVEFDARLTSK